MYEERKQESEQEAMERFDREVRQTLLDASNEYRREHGLPLISEEEVAEIDTLGALKERFKDGAQAEGE